MKVFSTLSGKKEEFVPQGDVVTMYVCGINPYSDAHIGHAMSYIFFDVVRRYLEFRDYKVNHVENVTDIEDNIIATANRLGIPVRELTDKYTERYFEDMDNLNILRPHHTPKATETISEIITMTQGLIDKGFAYAVGGDVYFRVRNVPDYGKLSKRSLESMMAGARIEAGEEKEDPMDFVLWKAAKSGEPSWDSPWGKGRPGWHIECSAMSLKFLGETIDIHGGGQDLVFPHHENEIVQSESFTGRKPFVKYWMHNGLLKMGEEKMSKSLGNLITIREALEKYSSDAIRVFVLGSYYRSPLTYTEAALEAAERGVERLLRVVSRDDPNGGKGEVLDARPYEEQFIKAMDDDFNTPQALGVLFDLAREINQAGDAGTGFSEAQSMLKRLARDALGLTLEKEDELSPMAQKAYNLAILIKENPQISSRMLEQMQTTLLALNQDNEIYNKLVNSMRNQLQNIAEKMSDKLAGQIQASLEQIYKNNATYNNLLATLQNQLQNIAILEQIYKNNDEYNNLLVLLRTQLREAKLWQSADEIRARLTELGIALEDTPQGTVWKRKR